MRFLLRIAVCASALVGLASGACVQTNQTMGAQSSGAVYVLYMPELSCWNGNLVVFAHGYVESDLPIGVPANQLSIGGLSLPATFNQLGYAFAASSFRKNGLAIKEGFSDTADLVQNILQPALSAKRVYLIGASEGGLITTLSAEQLPHVYNAAGAACGPIGNFQSQINYFGDFRVIFDYFFPGLLPGNAITILPGETGNWAAYEYTITQALKNRPSAAAQLISVMNAPVTSDPPTIAETVLGALWYNVFGTVDAVSELGGQPYDNHNRIYTGSANDLLLNLAVERYNASPTALAEVAAHYQTSGGLKMPIVTIHTTGDPVIPYWHETLYTAKTLAAGAFPERTNLPVANYGHCAFSAGDVLAAFALIVLRDTGASLTSLIENTLQEPHRSDFIAAVRRSQLAVAGK